MKHHNSTRIGVIFSSIVLGLGVNINLSNAQPDLPTPGTACQVTIQSVTSFQPAKRKDGSVIPLANRKKDALIQFLEKSIK